MKAFCFGLAALVLVVSANHGGEKTDKLVGFWEVVKGDETPPGSTVQFTNDGKLILTFKKDGETKKLKATYKVEGNKLITTRKNEGKVEVNNLTIRTLTDTALVTVNEKGKTEELKRKDKE